MTGYGDRRPRVLFVGEAPGRFGGDITGVPFTRDRSGRLFQKMLGEIGLSSSSPDDLLPKLHGAYVTNIVKCNPRDLKGRNRTPLESEIARCRKFLTEEIRILSPEVIAPLGVSAARQIIGDDFSSEMFARAFELGRFVVFPMWHPGFVIRGGGRERLTECKYRQAFLKLKELLGKFDKYDYREDFAGIIIDDVG